MLNSAGEPVGGGVLAAAKGLGLLLTLPNAKGAAGGALPVGAGEPPNWKGAFEPDDDGPLAPAPNIPLPPPVVLLLFAPNEKPLLLLLLALGPVLAGAPPNWKGGALPSRLVAELSDPGLEKLKLIPGAADPNGFVPKPEAAAPGAGPCCCDEPKENPDVGAAGALVVLDPPNTPNVGGGVCEGVVEADAPKVNGLLAGGCEGALLLLWPKEKPPLLPKGLLSAVLPDAKGEEDAGAAGVAPNVKGALLAG